MDKLIEARDEFFRAVLEEILVPFYYNLFDLIEEALDKLEEVW